MKVTMMGMAVLGSALLCGAVTIKYRDGHAMVCDVLAKDDTNLIVRTIKGVQTNTWRQLTPESIKTVYPELFERLKQQARDRQQQQLDDMKAKGMILVGGKWVDKKVAALAALARVKLNVITTESVGKYSEVERNKDGSKLKRPKYGVLKIKLDALDKTRSYTLRVQYTLFTKQVDSKEIKEVDKDMEKKETILKKDTHFMEIRTTPADEYKDVVRGVRGVYTDEQKIDIQGWDINIWLGKTLIFEQTHGSKPVYHHVTQW